MTGHGPILLVGCGKMGGALLEGWIARGTAPSSIHVVDPAGPDLPSGVALAAGFDALPDDFDPAVVLLAVKPQVMDEVLPPYAGFVGPETVFLSIAAGRTVASFTRLLGEGAAIVRAMPNTPAAVGRGMTVLYANDAVSEAQRAVCGTLMSAVGEVAWIEDEGQMDAVTGLSGSGPAYVFHMVEAMAEAGVAAGLPADLAMRLARATVAGSGALLAGSPEDAGTLRRNVTSPGGTTAAGLEVLMGEDALARLMRDTVAKAAARSRELAG